MEYEEKNKFGTRSITIAELQQQGWLKQIEWYDRIDSTNSQARRLLATDSLQTPAVLVADEQTSGRGRSERRWWSPQGCLMLTLVVDSESFVRKSGEACPLALLCGVALADAVAQSLDSQACQLKWPNDLYVSGKKLAGILIESLRSSATVDQAIWLVGIGLNVNVAWVEAPEEVRQRATCMSRVAGKELQCEQVLVDVVESMQRWLQGWHSGQLHWLSGWSERCLLTGKWVSIRQGHSAVDPTTVTSIEGFCEGVDSLGRLLVRSDDECVPLSIGEVVSWGEPHALR